MFDSIEIEVDPIAAANLTAHPFPDETTLNELIADSVRRFGARPAIRGDAGPDGLASVLTYEEWDRRAGVVARQLRARGVGPGDIVGLLVERSFALLVGVWAVLKCGAAYLPLSPDDPAERLAYTAQDARVRLLLVQTSTAAKAPPEIDRLDLESAEATSGAAWSGAAGNGPGDLAYVIYTSGSTGRPKGVMIEHRAVVNRLHWMQRMYPLNHDDVLLQKTSCSFDVSVWELFWWALAGASLALLRPRGERSPAALIDAVSRHRVTTLHFVPSMLSVFLEYAAAKPSAIARLGSLRQVFASGEALAPAQVERFNRLLNGAGNCRLTNLYGPTEATVDATYFDCPGNGPIASVPIGRPIQNLRAYVLRGGQPAAKGEEGELCLAGVGLARGYLNRPELTQQRFGPHPTEPGERIYRTGDRARWRADGQLEYLGREDHQVKIRGLRIELGEIENSLREFPGVTDCAVLARTYSESIILLVAYVVASEPVADSALREHLRGRLPDYMVPSHFIRLAELPLTASGKMDRKALPEPKLGRDGT
ncbi:MAG TPA: amino acid adenylation domain-containing protein [Opitutaceae bacterium]|jgi:amino acid adenylation domain-containing protein